MQTRSSASPPNMLAAPQRRWLVLLLALVRPCSGLVVERPREEWEEVRLRRASSPRTGDAAESMTASCHRLGYWRMHHGHVRYSAFWMSKDDSSYSTPASSPLGWFNGHELGYADIFDFALRSGNPNTSVVLDVGSNTGFYALSAATTYGYHAKAFDMQPECIRRARCASLMNFVEGRVQLHLGYATDDLTSSPVDVVGVRCFGGIGGDWEGRFDWFGYKETVLPVHLGQYIRSLRHAGRGASDRVALMKIDIEGGEVAVLRSLSSTPDSAAAIDHLLIEYSPHMWEGYNISIEDGVQALWGFMATGGFWAVDVPEFATMDTRRVLQAAAVAAASGQPAGGAPAPAEPAAAGAPPSEVELLTTRADIEAYTRDVLRVTAQRFAVYTVWLFRPLR